MTNPERKSLQTCVKTDFQSYQYTNKETEDYLTIKYGKRYNTTS